MILLDVVVGRGIMCQVPFVHRVWRGLIVRGQVHRLVYHCVRRVELPPAQGCQPVHRVVRGRIHLVVENCVLIVLVIIHQMEQLHRLCRRPRRRQMEMLLGAMWHQIQVLQMIRGCGALCRIAIMYHNVRRCCGMRQKKLKKLAEKFLWENSGDSVGCYGGGKRVGRKMPWNRLKKNEQ